MAMIINPQPNSANMPSHNTYSKTTITTIKISLRTTGEATKLRNRLPAGRLSFAFRLGLDLLLALDTGQPLSRRLLPGFPHLHNHRDDDGTTMNSLIEESAQGIFYSGINESWFAQAFSIMVQGS
jgi:hypothetical protein